MQYAVQQDFDEIKNGVIRKTVPEARSDVKQQATERLTEHQQILYEIISGNDGIGGGELYEKYCSRVESPKTQRTMRNYMAKLEQYGLLRSEGNTKGQCYHAVT
jgi:Cdc6-like AAA superfamily ATPase